MARRRALQELSDDSGGAGVALSARTGQGRPLWRQGREGKEAKGRERRLGDGALETQACLVLKSLALSRR